MTSPNPFNFDRPKRLLPGPIWAKIVGGLGLIFFTLGIIFAPIGGTLWLRGMPEASIVFLINGAVFSLVGGILLFIGARPILRWRRLLAEGVPTWGVASNVGYNYNTRVNRRHPIMVSYSYVDQHGQTHQGEMSSLDEPRLRALALDKLQVLYDPDHPERSLLLDLV